MPDGSTPEAPEARVLRDLAERTGTQATDWHLVFKARHGMEVVFRTLRDERGDGAVVTQLLTCATAVDPILVAGMTPVYAEVSPASTAIDPDRLEPPAGMRALVIQHTFGIVDDARAAGLGARAREHGALVVEDSAHCLGRMAHDDDGAPVADVSVHSFGVEKMLPTFFGGAVWVNPALDNGLRTSLTSRLMGLPVVGRRLDAATRAYRVQLGVLNRIPRAARTPLRKALVAAGAMEPPIAPTETRGGLSHPPLRPSAWMLGRMARAMPLLSPSEARRSAAVGAYVEGLAGVVEVPTSIGAWAPLVRFPFFAADEAASDAVIGALADAGFYGGRWYRPALFPGADDPAAYGYAPGDPSLATSEDLVSRVVNLPTDVDLDTARRIVGLVRLVTGSSPDS